MVKMNKKIWVFLILGMLMLYPVLAKNFIIRNEEKDVRYRMSDIGCQKSELGCQISEVRYQNSDIKEEINKNERRQSLKVLVV